MAISLPTISGNHERQVLSMRPEEMGASDLYAAQMISATQRKWLETLPAKMRISQDVFLCHATPTSDVECYLEDIRDEELLPAPLARIEERTAGCDAALIFCGHTHIPRVVHLRTGQIIVNPGSVGIQAYHGHHPVVHRVEIGSPHARYAIAERAAAGWLVEMFAVPYDWESAAQLAQTRRRPDWVQALRTGFL
jgi:diadenosine tetraphosphatase ApaH/serine/threonine PP2A family protein phosphatase